MSRPRILTVDDHALTLKLLGKVLGDAGYEAIPAASGDEALECLKTQAVDAAIVDVRMPGMSGIQLLHEIRRHDPSIVVLMATANPEVRTAVEALKAGAYDYVQKPFNLDALRYCIARMMEHRFLRGEVTTLRKRLGEETAKRDLIGGSPQIAQVKLLIAKVAGTDSAVLIEGESGTGKELVATAVHRLSTRSAGPFIPVNCGAIPPDLMESEFFGHMRGAFSGAVSDTQGLFRSAQGGTLFLDEVGEIPPGLQAKLLRALQEKQVRPVGASKSCAVDCRIIAATNRDIEQSVKDGTFRNDLYYRLNVVRIAVPPLRERTEDIPALVSHFLRVFNERFGRAVRDVAPDAMAMLTTYDFPGNVRELENLIERAYALGATTLIAAADFPPLPATGKALSRNDSLPTLLQMEREMIQRALRLFDHDREKAARALGISPRTMFRRLKEYGLR